MRSETAMILLWRFCSWDSALMLSWTKSRENENENKNLFSCATLCPLRSSSGMYCASAIFESNLVVMMGGTKGNLTCDF